MMISMSIERMMINKTEYYLIHWLSNKQPYLYKRILSGFLNEVHLYPEKTLLVVRGFLRSFRDSR